MKLRQNSLAFCVKGFTLTLLLVPALISCNQRADFHRDHRAFFHRLTGTWVLEDGKTFESWKVNPDSTFSGRSYVVEGKDTVVFEKLRIVEEVGKVYYEALVEGQNDGLPVRFELVTSSRNEIIFTNIHHDFPKKIHYTAYGNDRMQAVVSGETEGAEQVFVIHYTRYFPKKRVTGIGGIFFKCENPGKMREWYGENLGLAINDYGSMFEFRLADKPEETGYLQWSPFSENTTYFLPSQKDFMLNYRVENLEELIEKLKINGVTILDTIESYDYGKFVHILDPEGNKIELWEPVDPVFTGLYEGATTK